ncbi:MAG: hypothetical protein QXW00_04405 [Candidatus Woesearchaeota archaeon]
MSFKGWVEKRIRSFTMWDWALAKAVLVLLGVIIGAYATNFVRSHILYFAAAFLSLYALLIYRLLIRK